MDGKLIILGCGGSAGVPTVSNWWGKCDPSEPRNLRTRPSAAIVAEGGLVVIDAGPDFRDQMNREKLGPPDAIIITHEHADHINGLDELRTLQRLFKRKFPLYAFPATLEKLTRRLDYMFIETEGGFYPAVLEAQAVNPGDTLDIGGMRIQTHELDHGTISSLGVRIGSVAYSTDLKRLNEDAYNRLQGVETWVVDAAGDHHRSNPVHACVEEIIEMNQRVGAKKVYLTHLPPSMDYHTLMKTLPEGYEPAYDGMIIPFSA